MAKVAKGVSSGGSPDKGRRGQKEAAVDDGGAGVAAAPLGKKTAAGVKSYAGDLKKKIARAKAAKELAAKEAATAVVFGGGAAGLSSGGGGGAPVGRTGAARTGLRSSVFGDTSPQPSDDESPKLKDPPEWGLVGAQEGEEGVDEGVEEAEEYDSGSVYKPTGGNDSDSYSDSMFDSETEQLDDLTYYQVQAGQKGRKLTKGGPERPNTSDLSKEAAEEELKKWRIQRKKYTDKIAV